MTATEKITPGSGKNYQLRVRLIIDVFLFDLLQVRTGRVCVCFFFPSYISINCLQGHTHTRCALFPFFGEHYTSVMERSLLIEAQADYKFIFG